MSYKNMYLVVMNFFFASLTCSMFVATIFPHGLKLTNEVASKVSRPLLLSTLVYTGNMSLWNYTYRNHLKKNEILQTFTHAFVQYIMSAFFGFTYTRIILVSICLLLLKSKIPAIVIDLSCACIICFQNVLNFVFFNQNLIY
jgi:hypothetical protein